MNVCMVSTVHRGTKLTPLAVCTALLTMLTQLLAYSNESARRKRSSVFRFCKKSRNNARKLKNSSPDCAEVVATPYRQHRNEIGRLAGLHSAGGGVFGHDNLRVADVREQYLSALLAEELGLLHLAVVVQAARR
jgi:general stress protein YciG